MPPLVLGWLYSRRSIPRSRYCDPDGSVNFRLYASTLLAQHEVLVLGEVVRTIQTNYGGMQSWDCFCDRGHTKVPETRNKHERDPPMCTRGQLEEFLLGLIAARWWLLRSGDRQATDARDVPD